LVPPDGLVWGDTHGLAQDEQGNIYVAHTVNKSSMREEAVVIYDSSGRFIRAFGEEFRGGAHGLVCVERKARSSLSLRYQSVQDDEDHAEWRTPLGTRLSA